MYDTQILFEKIGPKKLCHFLFFIYLAYGKMWIVYMHVCAVFTNYIPDYRCSVPLLDDKLLYPHLTQLEILNYTTKYDNEQQKYDFCTRYGYNTSTCVNGSLDCVDTSLPTIPCDRDYAFTTSVMEITAVTKFMLVCDRLFLNSLSTSAYFLGKVAACIVFGYLADNIGRMKSITLGQIIFISGLLLNTFSTNITMYIITRFVLAFGDHGSEVALTVYASELTTSKTRTFFYGMINGGSIMGIIFLSGFAYIWKSDFAITLAATLGTAPFFILTFILNESPRWLLAKNKTDQATKAIKLMGRVNGVRLTDHDFEEAKIASEDNEHEGKKTTGKRKTFIDLFRSREMSKIVALLTVNWFVCVFVYYGITLNAAALSGNIFLNNALNALMEAASYIFIFFIMDRIGRRKMLACSHLIAGFGLLANTATLVIFPNISGVQQVAKVLTFTAKFAISLCFGIVYQYTNELFPTELRSNGFGFCTTFGRIGPLFAPFLIDLQQVYKWLPSATFGGVAVIAGLSTFLLPDTVGMKLLETEEEAIHFYNNWRSIGNQRVADNRSKPKVFFTNAVFKMEDDG